MSGHDLHVAITGGAGFLGVRLARAILARGALGPDGRPPAPVARLTLLDRVEPPADLAADPRVRIRTGELSGLLASGRGLTGDETGDETGGTGDGSGGRPADVVFHLASAVSGECERDFDLGIEANLRAGHHLLEACRALPDPPVLVFASSLAVYGQWPGHPLPEVVTDTTLPTPRTSYGIQKFVLEQLVTDYTRKGFLRGRSVRLMTVSVRPGRPNAAASGFLSGIIREPLAGLRATCPVPPETAVALASPDRTITGLLRAAEATADEWGPPLGMNLPALHTTVGAMVEALTQVAGPAAAELIDWAPDPAIEEIVTSWPARFETARAAGLGLAPDPDFVSIVRAHLAERT